jgi:hypothetical protein
LNLFVDVENNSIYIPAVFMYCIIAAVIQQCKTQSSDRKIIIINTFKTNADMLELINHKTNFV